MKNQQTLTVRRDTGAKEPVPMADICTTVFKLLDSIQNDMFIRAKQTFDSCLKEITRWEDMVPALDAKCIAVIPWCELEACEDDIKDRSGRVLVFLQVVFKLGFDEFLYSIQRRTPRPACSVCWCEVTLHSVRSVPLVPNRIWQDEMSCVWSECEAVDDVWTLLLECYAESKRLYADGSLIMLCF
jgi:hypothetical protein